eukprot:TRINITY_DN15957_c0_g1_i5.p2 TRINITY_DN15957_c0_g1~~TRINITY_DN15957_c0_g1_i5.p2  ORF type:complete len:150 (+),score=2.60 TRINITY_DN15957_c0_g1_i5:1217-1666(+)
MLLVSAKGATIVGCGQHFFKHCAWSTISRLELPLAMYVFGWSEMPKQIFTWLPSSTRCCSSLQRARPQVVRKACLQAWRARLSRSPRQFAAFDWIRRALCGMSKDTGLDGGCRTRMIRLAPEAIIIIIIITYFLSVLAPLKVEGIYRGC